MLRHIIIGSAITLIVAAAMAATFGGWMEQGSIFASYDMAGGNFILRGVVGEPTLETSSGGDWVVTSGRLIGSTQPCSSDFNGNGIVDVDDMLVVIAEWGQPGGDLNGDGTTGIDDLLILLAHYGPCD
jgi:hypothetical protein